MIVCMWGAVSYNWISDSKNYLTIQSPQKEHK